MNQISSYLLLGFEGTDKDLFITFGLDGDAAAPVVAPTGGGTSRRKRRATTIRFSDFERRDEYARKLKDAVAKSGIALIPADAIIAQQERITELAASKALADSEIRISAKLRARIEAAKDDEDAMMLLLLTAL